ncbi:MAG: hypothetical protein ACOYYJ_06490 [Chloroflexota bacterium]
MKISESARYMVDTDGNRTDVVIPFETWQKLVGLWERLSERLEDQEDRSISTRKPRKARMPFPFGDCADTL